MNEKVWKVGYNRILGTSPSMTIVKNCVASITKLCLWILVSSLTMTEEVMAACTPAPNCDEIGYTETSCEGDSLKCPFDITKLYCVPCDSSFKYDCNGNNMTGGSGIACNGKYASCLCSGGTIFSEGECLADNRCKVGAIYYTDGSCSSAHNTSKNVAGIVVKEDELVMSPAVKMMWGGYGTDINNIDNVIPSETAIAIADMNGKQYTAAIVAQVGSANSNDYAAVYCYNYYPAGMESTQNQWYLPSAGELFNYGYANFDAILETANILGWSYVDEYAYWSSLEMSENLAWYVRLHMDTVYGNSKNANYAVACFLEI